MRKEISEWLISKGFVPNLKGFIYICEAVENYDNGISLIKELYPKIAQKFDVTPSRVERNIRHSIERACDLGLLVKDEVLGLLVSENKSKPTNGEFISYVNYCINLKETTER